MSRLLKQVYSQNIYVQFRFESSLRKYDKKPTKKIKCEAFCKHCINHHKKIEYSPLKDIRPNIEYRSKFKKSHLGSIQRRQQKEILSSCKTIKLSKQKSSLKNDKNLLEMKLYRGLLQEKLKENDKVQKSQEENSSSMEQEIFFNQFGHSPQEESNKDSMDKDFDRIQITNRSEGEQEKNFQGLNQQRDVQLTVNKQQENIVKGQIFSEEEEMQQVQFKQQGAKPIFQEVINLPIPMQNISQQVIPQQPINQITIQQQVEIKPMQTIQNMPQQNLQENTIQNESPALNQHIFEEMSEIIQQRISEDNQSGKKMIEQKFMADSMMDKCLLFEGGRIYVDTSGQNFYISVRVFNKLRRQYSSTQELTKMLIQQRPCLEHKKDKIKHQLEEYLESLV